jgi:glycosyltransferase involved in cell wall biosynthesis
MKLSIIIPVKDDARVLPLLSSLQAYGSEVVVVCNGTPPSLRSQLPTWVTLVALDSPNLGQALQVGVEVATSPHVLLLDSDCRIDTMTCAIAASELASGHSLVRGLCVFEHNDWISRIIAEARTISTSEVKGAYKPPLAINKQVIAHELGHFFNQDILWCEDAELDYRRASAGIPVHYVDTLRVYHDRLNLVSDLRSALRYGRGYARARLLRLKLMNYSRTQAPGYSKARRIVRAYLRLFELVEALSSLYFLAHDSFLVRRARG